MIDYVHPKDIKYLGALPDGYEYQIIKIRFKDGVRIIGLAEDKPPVTFDVNDEGLMEVIVDE